MLFWLTPLFLNIILNIGEAFKLLLSARFTTSAIFDSEFAQKLDELRFYDGGRILFNKTNVILNEIFSAASSLNPRIYFYAGDGSRMSPGIVEPLAVLLFPFFVIGLLNFLNKRYVKQIILLFIFAGINYFLRPNNILFLTPIATIYLWVAINYVPKILRKPIVCYSLFLILRMILI